jgi:hypothetical protein
MWAVAVAVCVIAALRAAQTVLLRPAATEPPRGNCAASRDMPPAAVVPRATHEICDALVYVRESGLYMLQSAAELAHVPVFSRERPIFIAGGAATPVEAYRLLYLHAGDMLDVSLHGAAFTISYIF